MEEKPKIIIDDDDIEILDFDDDIVDESPENKIIPEEEFIIYDVTNEIDNIEPVKEETNDKEIQQTSNTSLLNQALNSNNENKVLINEEVFKKETPKVVKDVKPKSLKQKSNSKRTIVGILIFVILLGTIISLPFISNYFNTINKNNKSNNTTNVSNVIKENYKSNIDVEKSLQTINNYKNYQYKNINIITTKDNTGQLMSIKNNYTYSFNETKFELYVNKTVVDFSYEIRDYYEKLDNVYNLYINDVTTNTYSKRNTTIDEFDKIINMFPNAINYLMRNYSVTDEKLIRVDNKEHTDITIKTPKEIINYLSLETDRIQNKVNINSFEQEYVYVDLLFDENEKLYKIEIEIEDKNASQEQLETDVESAILKYIFTDFNQINDIVLPNL
ncbi:MAG: hypothetical protein E7166_02160 [Firmicutes bacterium]|nr:hypothetical protein [Bacillota bacterium]